MGVFDWLTGKSLESKIDTYGNVYGEVLLGIHRDVESQNRRIHDYSKEMQALLESAHAVQASVEQARREAEDAAQEVATCLKEAKSVEQRTRVAADEGAVARDEAKKIAVQFRSEAETIRDLLVAQNDLLNTFQLKLGRQRKVSARILWLSIGAWLTALTVGVVLWTRG